MSTYKRGALDPDYRRKEWRGTHFSPSRSSLSISQLSLALALIPACILLYASPNRQLFSLQGFAVLGVFILITQGLIARLLRRLTRRKIVEDYRASYFKTEQLVETPAAATSYRDFEHEVAHLFNRLSSYKAVVVGGSNDRGIDIELFRAGKLVGIVQCKQYRTDKPLSPSFVRELYGCKKRDHLPVAYLVTTSYFSRDTRRAAAELEVKLIEGDRLNKMRQAAKVKAQRSAH